MREAIESLEAQYPAAVANAIYRAVGARMTELPMSPAKVVEVMKK